MIVKAAFGAITGSILGLLLDPLLNAMPEVPILTVFIDSLASEVLTVILAVTGAFLLSRIERLDHFIATRLPRITIAASILIALSLWLDAGTPTTLRAFVSLAVTVVTVALSLGFCGWVVQIHMQGFTADQEREATARREREAEEIAQHAVAMGDPQAAVGIYSVDLAGRVGQAYGMACLGLVLLPTLASAILLAATLDAHFLYGLPWLWAVATGVVISIAGVGALGFSAEVGEVHAHQVPLDEKYEEILPRGPDPNGS